MQLRGLLPVAIPFLAIAGCLPQPPPAAAPRRVQLEGAAIRAAADPLTGLSSYDPQLLFHLAGEARRQGRLEDAAVLYERLLQEFPSSTLVVRSRFHLGLVFEQQEHYERAAAAYSAIVSSALPGAEPERRTWIDAHFRLALCATELGELWRAVAVFDRLLALDGLADFDRLEALVGRGMALRHAGDLDAAEGAFARALRVYEDASSSHPFPDRGLASEAAFQAGEIAAERYAAVRLEFPVEVLRERLERKCELLLAAQRWYLRAVRYGDGKAATAAGYRIGSLYETLYEILVEPELPPELTPEEAEVYREEVRTRLSVLVKKAIVVYERSLLLGRSVAAAGEWLERLDAALARLRRIYLAEPSNATSTRGAREGA